MKEGVKALIKGAPPRTKGPNPRAPTKEGNPRVGAFLETKGPPGTQAGASRGKFLVCET